MSELRTVADEAMSPAGDIVRLAGLSKTYPNGTVALSPVSTGIAAGSFVSLVGPSGCGKSTLLRLLADLVPQSGGEAVWSGENGRRPDDIGFVFQDATLMPWATVFDNVYLPLRLRGTPRAAASERVAEALSLVRLGGQQNALSRELSGGMRMRVSIARALVTRPAVLFMDEPFAALDEFTRADLDDELLGLWRSQGWTILFVTHSVYEAVYLSERVLVFSARPGRLIADIGVEAPDDRRAGFRDAAMYISQCRAVSNALREGFSG